MRGFYLTLLFVANMVMSLVMLEKSCREPMPIALVSFLLFVWSAFAASKLWRVR